MIDRKLYLELCQRNAVGGVNVVMYEEVKYYPVMLQIWFNDKGEPQNTAVLQDLNLKSFTNCRLQDVYLDKTK
jgi:hypothetical protein